jgi:hypothetical protein
VAKFAASVVDTCGAPSVVNIFTNLDKIQNDLNVMFRKCGEMIHGKKPEAKYFVTRAVLMRGKEVSTLYEQ